jgi:hypothetical protein
MLKITTFLLLLAAIAPAYGQMYKSTDKDGKVQYSDKPPVGQVKPVPGTKSSSSRSPSANTLSFAEAGGSSAVQISAPEARFVRQGDDVELILPMVHLRKNISGVGDVQFEDLQFFLHRRGADGSRQYLGKSDKDASVKGKLTDGNGTGSFQNAKMKYQNAARECPDACVLSLTVWIKHGNTQSGGLSGPVEVQMK